MEEVYKIIDRGTEIAPLCDRVTAVSGNGKFSARVLGFVKRDASGGWLLSGLGEPNPSPQELTLGVGHKIIPCPENIRKVYTDHLEWQKQYVF